MVALEYPENAQNAPKIVATGAAIEIYDILVNSVKKNVLLVALLMIQVTKFANPNEKIIIAVINHCMNGGCVIEY